MTAAPHNQISPTAKFVAFLRTLSDIPYSTEIAEACNAREKFEEMVGENPQDFLWTAPLVEMRYKSVDEVLRRYFKQSRHHPNLLELAAGVSPRGLIWSKAPSVTYLETDLPEILAEKKAIITDILGSEQRKTLKWLPLNAIHSEHFIVADSFFDQGPIAVLNEGLLPYLDREEKEKVARNIHRLLTKRGGVWITPDISSNDRIKELIALDPKIGRVMQVISGFTGRNMQANSFGSLEEAESFFKNIGFRIMKWNQRDLGLDLTSLQKVEVDPKKLEILTERGMIWALEVQ